MTTTPQCHHGGMEKRAGINDVMVDSLNQLVLGWQHKAISPQDHGRSGREFIDNAPSLAQLQTPLLTLDADAMRANRENMARWCAEHGVLLAPHGKTTMSPQLWRDQLRAGAWGMSLANASQLRVGHAFGLERVMIANTLLDPSTLLWLADTQGENFKVVSWVDCLRTVELQGVVLSAVPGAQIDVILELGAAGGRTGARSLSEALEIAYAVHASPHHRLVGVGGYEGSLAHAWDKDSLAAVRGYLTAMKQLHQELQAQNLYEDGCEVIVTAGGSAYFDEVVSVLGECVSADPSRPVALILRSGAYLIHDDGFYRGISPFSRGAGKPLVAAMHGWARVVSKPEAGLAILDAGKRDVPFDEGLPQPQMISRSLGKSGDVLHSAAITAVNDQHSFMRFDPLRDSVRVGDVVRLGLSHPCTAFDKWTLIPVLANSASETTIVDLIHTYF